MKNLKIYTVLTIAFVFFTTNFYAQSNKNNPYDNAGFLHNKIVNEFLKKYSKKKISNDQVIKISNQLCKKNGLPQANVDINFIENGVKNISNFKLIVNKSKISANAKKYLNKLFKIIEAGKGDDNFDYNKLYNSIIKLESSILKDKNLIKQDKKILLEATSIARYSGYLWNNKYNNTSTRKRKWWKWLIVVAADVAGGVYGGVSGAVGASSLGDKLVDKIE